MPLYLRQTWLPDREDMLIELLDTCKSLEQKFLIIKLLHEFNFMDSTIQRKMLDEIAHYIANESGFDVLNTQIVATTIDEDADSGQQMLQIMKLPLYDVKWDSVRLVNRFGKAVQYINKKKFTQVIVIDEFIGSGKTILNRIESIKNDAKVEYELKFCFLAGMDFAIKKIEDAGYEVFCPLRYERGISDRFSEEQLVDAVLNMRDLEETLMRRVSHYDLLDYKFGYNKAESLHSMEGCNGNTPNSVFPIFWWPRDRYDRPRQTLLTRFEKGLR